MPDAEDALLAVAQSLGLGPERLRALAERLGSDPDVTVAEYLPRVEEVCPTKSVPTYRPHWRRLVAVHGAKGLAQVTTADLLALAKQVQADVVTAERAKGHRVDEDRTGRGAVENFVRAMRRFFNTAIDDAKLDRSPAEKLRPIPRAASRRRALTAAEIEEVWLAAIATSRDPELDGLILDFIRETAARREGVLNLTVGAIDPARRAIELDEKFAKRREIPGSTRLLERLLEHAIARGATGDDDPVFRYSGGRPLTRRRFNTLFDKLQGELGWADRLGVSAHWIRHTTLTDVSRVAGDRIARAYAGHSDTSSTTDQYTKASWEELLWAHDVLFGA